MANIPSLTSVSGSNASVDWSPVAIRTSVLDQTNPVYPRIWRLDDTFLTLAHSNYTAGIELSAALAPLLALVPQLTWPPLITVQPVAIVNAAPSGSGSITITATSEISVTYQWQVSVGGGAFSNLTNTGVYSGATTNTLAISSYNGLNGNAYRCIATNASGSTTSNAVTITTDPSISVQPSSISVAHPAVANFSVMAIGQTALSYQWQLDSGGGFSNLSNGGVYSLVTTAAMHISDSTGLNGNHYRCIVTDTNGSVTSSSATLTVT